MTASVFRKTSRYHPYFGTPSTRMSPQFNSTSIDHRDDTLRELADLTPLMVSNISLSPITPSAKGDNYRGDEVSMKDLRRPMSLRKIKEICKFSSRRRIKMWKPEEILESTRISETSTVTACVPPTQLPILPNAKYDNNNDWTSDVVGCQGSTQTHKGQLKVSIYINSGLLTIHVIQGRHFTSKWKTTCDSYVTVELIPETNAGCSTDVILDTNHPLYEEKFSFELLPEDGKKRALISVYHKTFKSRKHELLGCMSFGLRNITENKAFVNGWYYLLPESIGRRKHLQVTDFSLSTGKEITKCGVSPITYKTHCFLINRGSSGYGFTVTGGCPAKVCRVDSGGPAEGAGLKSGDCIIRINKERVHTASTDGVARIIKHCTRKVLLEIQRPHKSVESLAAQLPWRPMYNDLDSSMSSSEDEDEVAVRSRWFGKKSREYCATAKITSELRRRVTFRDFQ